MSEADRAVHPVSPWRLGLDAAKRNALPGVALALFALSLGLSYAYVSSVRSAMQAVADWRGTLAFPVDWLFPIVTTAVFGAVIPWIVQRLRPSEKKKPSVRDLFYLAGFWGFKGFEVNLLYLVLSMVMGDSASLGVVLGKIAFDMGLYCPLWAVPSTVIVYGFKDASYSWSTMKQGPLRNGWRSWWRWDVVPLMVNNWLVWVPAVSVIYTLPLALQLPMQNLVLCFWSLALVFMTDSLATKGRAENLKSETQSEY